MDLNQCIDDSVTDFFSKYGNLCSRELDTLAYFHLYFFDILRTKLKNADISISLKRRTLISSFHVDKTPIVEMNKNPKDHCELADLLLIVEVGKDEKAILIQAKQKKSCYKGTSTKKEINLYHNWPNFDIIKPNHLNNQNYKITIGKNTVSRFMTFFGENADKFMIGDAIQQSDKFSTFFNEFIQINSNVGRLFKNPTCEKLHQLRRVSNNINKIAADNWDSLIYNVSEYIGNKYFTNKNLSNILKKRMNKTNLFFLSPKTPIDLNEIVADSNNDVIYLDGNNPNSEFQFEDDNFSFFSIVQLKMDAHYEYK